MREDLLDILGRLVSVRQALGETGFRQACHRARLAIAAVAMEHAEETARGARRAGSIASKSPLGKGDVKHRGIE